MGSTAKIIYSSVLAILIVSLFLIFYMQKSAQLVLDQQDTLHTIEKKELLLTNIQQELKEVTTQADNASKTVIPTLTSNLAAVEKEKDLLDQQRNELQERLSKQLADADKQLAEFKQLQEEYQKQQALLLEATNQKAALEAKTQNITANLNSSQELLDQKEEHLQQLNAAIHEKDQAIAFYSKKLEVTQEIITLAETENATRTMNLSLVLDELALKTRLVAKLQEQIGQDSGKTVVSGSQQPNAVSEISALIDKMNQETAVSTPAPADDELSNAIARINEIEQLNATLQSNINEQSARIQILLSDLQYNETSFISLQEELAKQQIDNDILNEELTTLQSVEEEAGNALTQLQILLTDRENELQQTVQQSQEIIMALTDKASDFELQLTEAATLSATNSDEQQAANNSLTEELVQAQSALDESGTTLLQNQHQFDELKAQYAELQVLIDEQNVVKDAAQSEFDTQLSASATALQTAVEESDTLKKEIEQFSATVEEKDTTIGNLTAELQTSKEQVAAFEASLAQSAVLTTDETNANAAQQQEIERLTEVADAAKALSEEQATQLSSVQQELTELGQKNNALELSLTDNQGNLTKSLEEVTALQATLTTLTAERDQLLLMSTDSKTIDTAPETQETQETQDIQETEEKPSTETM